VPNSHKAAVSANPNAVKLRELANGSAERLGGSVVEFLFDDRKNVAYVTFKTPDDVRVTFAQVAESLADIDPDGIYWIGPLNIYEPDGEAAS
jgi:hypothetical protein